MKKISYVILILFILLLLGSCRKKTIKGPDEILIEGKIISYSDTLEQVEDKLGEGKADDMFVKKQGYCWYEYTDDLLLLFNEEDKMRAIDIEDEDIITYKNICVGDDIDKVADTFKYEIVSNRFYNVYFEGKEELDGLDHEKTLNKDWITITYYTNEDNEIVRISIMDKKYAMTMR